MRDVPLFQICSLTLLKGGGGQEPSAFAFVVFVVFLSLSLID